MLVILAEGNLKGGISQEGIDYYNNLIDEVIKNGKLIIVAYDSKLLEPSN